MRNVLVTGGSRGLGLGIARELAADGYRVIALARKMGDPLAAAISEAEKIRPGALHFVAFDLEEIDKISELVRGLHKQFGPLFGLVNNAGLGTDGSLGMMPNARIEQLVRVNTLSPIVLTKYVVRGMMAQGDGRIVNISSIVGSSGHTGLSVYAATKASLIGFTRSLAREVGRLGVTVNAVAPGFIDTEMTGGMTEAERAQIARRAALKRLPQIDDVAKAVSFLMGDGGRSISGSVMTIDAGTTA
jgi:3-oxoacyl-[acyl-carrier protein] reductase